MIHKPTVSLEGNAEEFRKCAEVLDKIQSGLEQVYLEKAREGITAEQIKEMMNQETWLQGGEMTKYFKVELLKPLKVLNCTDLKKKKYKNIPLKIKEVEEPAFFYEKIKIALVKAESEILR